MPIKPPRLDDRHYDDIVEEARKLIPQYCPAWTNLGPADPGMTLVQLFAWMTELTIYRLNKVPDKTYIHFLNFIGEERKRARPSVGPVTFTLRGEQPTEVEAFSRCATRQTEDKAALELLTVNTLTVHDSQIVRVMAVKGGTAPVVRELPFAALDGHPSALTFSGGRGIQFFDLDPLEYGPDAYTPHQLLYLAHDDLRLMDTDLEAHKAGKIRIRRSTSDNMSIVDFFRWEYPTADGWAPIETVREEQDILGLPEHAIATALPGIIEMPFEIGDDRTKLPEPVARSKWWIRGRLDYERWLSARMADDLNVFWRDDRGGEERPILNWEVRASGRTLEFFLQDLPPIRGGWTIRLSLVDRGVPAGRNAYLPRYRWSYRRGESWEEIPAERVRVERTMIVITGPLPDMASDGYNLRAERIETVFIRGFAQELDLELTWIRPVQIRLFAGDDPRRAEELILGEGPWDPFQLSPVIPPTIGRKFYIGADLFENRRKAPVLLEIEVAFEMNGEPVEEPKDLYALQMTYRAEDSWRVVWTEDKIYSKFTFADVDEEGAKKPGRRKIRFVLDPKEQLRGLSRHTISGTETTWLRLELIKSSLTGVDEQKEQRPIQLRVFNIRLGADKTLGDETYEQPMPNPRVAQLDFREENQRLTRVVTRAVGRLNEVYPFFPFVEIQEPNQALYLQFDKPLPPGSRHAVHVRCQGEAFLPAGVRMEWELLEAQSHGRTGWRRLSADQKADDGSIRPPYALDRSGVLEFPLPDVPPHPEQDGFWLRGRFVVPQNMRVDQVPPLPPITHVMLNTVDAVNLHSVRTERYSGYAVPHQSVQLLRRPLFLHEDEGERAIFPRPDKFDDIVVYVDEGEGERVRWRAVDQRELQTAGKDDRIFVVDPVDGTLTFGNGIRGRMLPAGSNNILVDSYRLVPGSKGNVGPHEVVVADAINKPVEVTNLVPTTGGRDAETIDEIVRRAPSLLNSRDRAVTRNDFEIIAQEASGEVARAACDGVLNEDGEVRIVILPQRREDEVFPDPFLFEGLRKHVAGYLKRRCLINVTPVVRLAAGMDIHVSIALRLRPNANVIQIREQASRWIESFLDPYAGGLDGEGWPFNGTLYAQDFARMVTDIPEVRHVVDVQLYDMSGKDIRSAPGWEESLGSDKLILNQHDLFVVRRVRVITEGVDA